LEEEKHEILTSGSMPEVSSSLVLGMEQKLAIVQGFHSEFESAIKELQAGVSINNQHLSHFRDELGDQIKTIQVLTDT
jgi:acid phosphatase family membrane protein YuiD